MIYSSFKSLAEKDSFFRDMLVTRSIDPNDPVPARDPVLRRKQMDEFFRKAKPILLLRQAFLKTHGEKRPRKTPTLYSGKESVYAVSEGKPRWLLGLLNDLCDAMPFSDKYKALKIPENKQAQIINAASRRFIALIKATPIFPPHLSDSNAISLSGLIHDLSKFVQYSIYKDEFPLDPVGSFTFADPIPKSVEKALQRALEVGAIVHIGRSPMDVPNKIAGERFRLSFMLCPAYKLPLRNYRSEIVRQLGRLRADRPTLRAAQLSIRFD
jgi:hypothetical protein